MNHTITRVTTTVTKPHSDSIIYDPSLGEMIVDAFKGAWSYFLKPLIVFAILAVVFLLLIFIGAVICVGIMSCFGWEPKGSASGERDAEKAESEEGKSAEVGSESPEAEDVELLCEK